MPDGQCTIGAEVKADIASIKDRLEGLDEEDQRLWVALNAVRELLSRPPAWCAWAMTALGTVAGALAGILATILAR